MVSIAGFYTGCAAVPAEQPAIFHCTGLISMDSGRIMDYIPAETIITKNKNPDAWFNHQTCGGVV